MKLTNFEISGTIEVTGLGHSWDLHNCVDFAGLELVPETGSAKLRWTIMSMSPQREQGFGRGNSALSCAIRFDGVKEIRLRRTDDGSEGRNARTLASLAMVAPVESTPEDVAKRGGRLRSTEETAHMMFMFMDGFDFEVEAEQATLVADG